MYYLFGTILTHYGSASLNHGQRKGNISPIQKCQWYDNLHSTVNADAIRWALRYYWQLMGYSINRKWDADNRTNRFTNESFDPENYIDDDVLGYMKAEAAKEDIVEGEEIEEEKSSSSKTEDIVEGEKIEKKKSPSSKHSKGKQNNDKAKGNSIQRMGALGLNRAISLIPYNGTITFNSKSGEKDRTSLHFIEYHNTRYQYVFALNINHIKDKSRIFKVIDALMSIHQVGGHNNVFCYDFSPESFILRWTQKMTPQIFYCFEQGKSEPQIKANLIEEINGGDVDPKELWIGGKIAKNTEINEANISSGKVKLVGDLKQAIAKDLKLTFP